MALVGESERRHDPVWLNSRSEQWPITIDGRDFDLDKLSGEARHQAMKINLVDQEIRRLQVQLKICQTARNAYATALQQALPKDQ